MKARFACKQVITGDIPVDEFSMAIKAIATEYEERFDRKPTVAEPLSAFELVVMCLDEDTLSDPENAEKFKLELS